LPFLQMQLSIFCSNYYSQGSAGIRRASLWGGTQSGIPLIIYIYKSLYPLNTYLVMLPIPQIYVQEVSYNYGIECREENYQDDGNNY